MRSGRFMLSALVLAFTGSDRGGAIQWGVEIGHGKGELPFIQRYDVEWTEPATRTGG
ncbi:MAG: hypothetical protein ACQCXQ_16045 [Verrucomicrobiales bacterium]|nr:hypothetical protein [Verrucomicrobiota bacterium JB025]